MSQLTELSAPAAVFDQASAKIASKTPKRSVDTLQLLVPKEIGSEQTSKSTIAALGKMPGSEGNHGQTAKHRQYCVNAIQLLVDTPTRV